MFRKKVTFVATIIAVFFLGHAPANAQWTRISNDSLFFSVRDVEFLNDEFGLAVGGPFVLRTEDGGRSWQLADSVTFKRQSLFSVSIDSTAVGVVSVVTGTHHIIGRSTDLGKTWTTANSGQSASPSLVDVCLSDGTYAAVGTGAWVFRSNDLGLSWSSSFAFPPADFGAATCGPDGTVWAGGLWSDGSGSLCCGILLSSADQAESWTEEFRFSDSRDGTVSDIQFVNDTLAFALSIRNQLNSNRAAFWRSTDGGETWSKLFSTAGVKAFEFWDERLGLMVGVEGEVRTTIDGGITWTSETLEPSVFVSPDGVRIPLDLHDATFLDDGTAIVAGDAGVFRHENFVATDLAGETPTFAGIRPVVYPNPASTSIRIDLGSKPRTPVDLKVLDVMGRVVATTQLKRRSSEIDLDGLAPGLYLYVTRSETTSATGTFVVR